MKPVLLIQQQHIELSSEDFYRAMDVAIDRASPPAHMSADFLGDRLAFGMVVYPPKVYAVIRQLKEEQARKDKDHDSGSREQLAEKEVAQNG